MKIYIAGKITGNPNYKQEFAEAAEKLTKEGHIVLNPAILPEGMRNEDYMTICFAMIRCADEVCVLPNFVQSEGAWLEVKYCQYIRKPVKDYLLREEGAGK